MKAYFNNDIVLIKKKGNMMEKFKEILKKIFKSYLLYIFIFAVLLFALQNPDEKQVITNTASNYKDIKERKSDRVALIESADDAILARLDLMENASRSLDISYYTLIDGKSTQIMFGSILDAADRGVKVRVLLDGVFHNLMGSRRDAIYGFELHPNIELKLYEPFNLISPWTWNNRLHDKIIIADEKIALIGGRNIGDQYFLPDLMKGKFVKDRDVVILKDNIQGDTVSVVEDMKDYYDSLWNYKHSKNPVKKLTAKQENRAVSFNKKQTNNYNNFKKGYMQEELSVDWYERSIEVEGIKLVYNPIGRVNQDPWCLRELLSLAKKSEKEILVQSPYVIPSRNIRKKIKDYEIDLGKVSILTNSVAASPNPLAVSGYINHKKKMIDMGMEIFEYQGPESIHAKTYIFDNDISVIGSFNFDARSSYINSESMVVIRGYEFTDRLKENINRDLKNSLQVGSDYSYIEENEAIKGSVSVFKKVFIGILSKITYLFQHLL